MNEIRSTVFVAVGAALTAALWKPLPAAAVNVTLTADSFTQASAATKNKGAGKTIELKSPIGGPIDKQGWVKFNLSTLPADTAGEDIVQATLVIFANKVSVAGALDVRRVSAAWTEGAITHSTAPALGLIEESAVPVSSVNSYVTADVTAVVKDWLDGAVTNNGLALVPNSIGLDARFDSKESKGTSHPPRLEIALRGYFGIPGTFNTRAGTFSLVSNTTGNHNAAFGYATLSFNTTGFSNTGIGMGALNANTSGNYNTAVGHGALYKNTLGTGNTALGASALEDNVGGGNNTALGQNALRDNMGGGANTAVGAYSLGNNGTGSANTAVGEFAMSANTTGVSNTAVGNAALASNLIGYLNTAVGADALYSNTDGTLNTAIGEGALHNNATGHLNIAVGSSAGSNLTTGNHNIMIGNIGVAGEANTIRVGDADQTSTYIAGIFGATSAGGTAVFVDGSGQLGTMTSSRRFKQQITDMGNTSDVLLRLHPVTFRYKPEIDPEGVTQYGLIAEEVAEVAPGLVQYDQDGNVHTVRYHLLVPMLLNELQKLTAENKRLRADAAVFDARLDAIENAVQAIRGHDAAGRAPLLKNAGYAGWDRD
jgi:hypothetical protein